MPQKLENIDAASYKSFMIRMWQDAPGSLWRASAQSVETGEIWRFANLQMLYLFLTRNSQYPLPEDEYYTDASAEWENIR